MHVCLMTPRWPGDDLANGIATAVWFLVHGFRARGHRVTILSASPADRRDDPDLVEATQPDPPSLLERLAARTGVDELGLRRRVAPRVLAAREAVRRGAEVLVVEESFGFGGDFQRALPIPVVITLHGPWSVHRRLQADGGNHLGDAWRERREAAALKAVAGVTSPSRDILETMRAAVGFTAPSAWIPNPVALGPQVDQHALGPEDARRLLFVGRFDRHKGGDVVLAAFASLIAGGADARLTFVGPDRGAPGPDGSIVRIDAALAALPEATRARIDYLGQLSKTEIEALRRRHAVTIIASRYENLNYTMLEALAAGSALVATGVGGMREVLRDGENGLLAPPDDPAALAAACARLLADPGLRARLGQAARATIAADFTPEAVADRFAAFLETIVAARRAHAR